MVPDEKEEEQAEEEEDAEGKREQEPVKEDETMLYDRFGRGIKRVRD